MDELDRQIVTALSEDARRSYTQIAKDLGVATSTVHGRVSRLLQQGLIRGFLIDLDWDALGLPRAAVIFLRSRARRTLPDVAEALSANPYIVNCSAITGQFDLFAFVRAKNPAHLGEIIDDVRMQVDAETETVVILDSYVTNSNPPLLNDEADDTPDEGDGTSRRGQNGKRSAR